MEKQTEISKLIVDLQNSNLSGRCPNPYCEKVSMLSDFIMFDGTGTFPDEAQKLQDMYEIDYKKAVEKFKAKKVSAVEGSEKKSLEVNFGNAVEKIIHLHKEFNFTLEDCRFLAAPLDFIIFDGAASNKVNHITFMDIKTGDASPNDNQKMIRDAVNDHRVKAEEIK